MRFYSIGGMGERGRVRGAPSLLLLLLLLLQHVSLRRGSSSISRRLLGRPVGLKLLNPAVQLRPRTHRLQLLRRCQG